MILIFFLLSVNFSGAEVNNSPLICPESFSCSDTTTFKYPFYNVKDPGCGLIKVNCTPKGGEIQIGGQSYLIVGMLNVNMNYPILLVWNMTFSHLLKNKKCEALVQNFNFPSPNPLLYSISLNGFITIFKCTENLTYFEQHNYNSYNRCKDHIFYYNYFNTSVPSDLPQTCQVVQLPMKLSTEAGLEETNIFSLLNPVTSIGFQLTPSCSKCNEKGRHCNAQNGYDHCSEDKWEKPGIKHSRERMIKILVSVLGVGSVILIIMVILCLREITKWRKKAKYNVKVEIFLKNHEFLAPKRYSYAQVKKMTNSFKFKLGQGGFSTVYKGVLGNQNLVAVKVLNDLKGDGEDFINEVASVGKTSHVNIVCLVGFCLEGRKRALIYEFMPNGSLERFIYSHGSSSSSQLGWEKLHHIAIGIARGLEYLHRGCSTRILHFDIKPHNILLDSDFCPKISDFGLAKALFREKESKICMSNMRGTPGYIAPELFSRNFGEVSHKSDVYSYGMMILEMVGGRKNIAVGVDHTSELYFPHWIYKKVELHEEQLGILKEIVSDEENRIARKMIIVGLWCIQTNPLSRPTITEVLEMLEGDLQSLEIPPKPFFSSPQRCDGSPSTNLSHPSGLCSST